MKTRWLARLGFLAIPSLLGAGCSLINAYDDVKAGVDAGGTGDLDSGGPNPDASGGTDGDVVDSSVIDAPTTEDAGPPLGFLVVSGLQKNPIGDGGDGGFNYVLSVLDPLDGGERSRELINAIGAYYDPHGDNGAGTEELWYVFEAPTGDAGLDAATTSTKVSFPSQIFTGPTTRTVLHVRGLDVRKGTWSEKGRYLVPPPNSAEGVVVLANRLSYVAYASDGGLQLVTLDTSNPANVSADAASDAAIYTDLPAYSSNFSLVGITGAPDTASNPTGGSLTLLEKDCTSPVGCQFRVHPLSVKADVILDKAAVPIGSAYDGGTNPSPGIGNNGSVDIVALPSPELVATPVVAKLDKISNAISGSFPFNPGGKDFKPLAYSKCLDTAFVCERLSNNVSAVPFANGVTGAKQDWGNRCAQVAYEPYSSSVILPFLSVGSYVLRRLPVTKSGTTIQLGAAVNLGPGDLAPYQVAVRTPPSFTCP